MSRERHTAAKVPADAPAGAIDVVALIAGHFAACQTVQARPQLSPDDLAQHADYQAARELCRIVALRTDVCPKDVFDTLDAKVPSNLQFLLGSPEGWAALAEYVLPFLGVVEHRSAIWPTIH